MVLHNDGGSAHNMVKDADRAMSEDEWEAEVMAYAKAQGWLCAHFRPAMLGDRWITAMTGDAGFPDLVLARNGVVVLAELKKWGKRPTEAQRNWLRAANGIWWTPEHRVEMEEVLR